jgi:hypothetical protein
LTVVEEMVVGFMWLLADRAIFVGGEAGGFEHVASSESKGEYGGKVVVKLM